MAYKMNLWSLTLLPGERYPMYIRRDFVLTNAALGEDLKNKDGRSVVKVTHQPLPPHFGDDSDSELDSDLEISDEEGDEDEYEMDEEEGFKLTPKKKKAEAEGEAMSEDDDEELDEDDEEDDDFSDDEETEETNVICSLTAGRIEQTSLDLTFVSGDAVMFEVTGDNAVHLLGNYIYQAGLEDSDDDDESDFDSEEDDYDIYGDDLDEELDSDEDVPAGKITEIEAEVVPKATKAAKAAASPAVDNKKRKADAIESPAPKADAAAEATENLSKAQKKKLAKKAKRESGASEAAPAVPEKKAEAKKDAKPAKRTLASGLIIEDVKVGDGPVAKGGKRLGMRYIGKLESGKQFDANTSGKPFSFVLGRGEVIRGWDEGLNGMAVGGERRLTIPAPLAYGNQKLPGIPKGSTLKFDVKLVSVN